MIICECCRDSTRGNAEYFYKVDQYLCEECRFDAYEAIEHQEYEEYKQWKEENQ